MSYNYFVSNIYNFDKINNWRVCKRMNLETIYWDFQPKRIISLRIPLPNTKSDNVISYYKNKSNCREILNDFLLPVFRWQHNNIVGIRLSTWHLARCFLFYCTWIVNHYHHHHSGYEQFPQIDRMHRIAVSLCVCLANVHHFISCRRGLCDKCWRFGSHAILHG